MIAEAEVAGREGLGRRMAREHARTYRDGDPLAEPGVDPDRVPGQQDALGALWEGRVVERRRRALERVGGELDAAVAQVSGEQRGERCVGGPHGSPEAAVEERVPGAYRGELPVVAAETDGGEPEIEDGRAIDRAQGPAAGDPGQDLQRDESLRRPSPDELAADQAACTVRPDQTELTEADWVSADQLIERAVSFRKPIYRRLIAEFEL